MYQFICEHIVPGCHHEDTDEAKADLVERAASHLREHHQLDHRDDAVATTLEKTGIVFIRPA